MRCPRCNKEKAVFIDGLCLACDEKPFGDSEIVQKASKTGGEE